jgi:hypothetical protein
MGVTASPRPGSGFMALTSRDSIARTVMLVRSGWGGALIHAGCVPAAGGGRVLSPDTASDSASSV